LKSGNSPAFKMIAGDSPITYGVGNMIPEGTDDDGKGGKGKGWAKVGLAALTGGLDAVYGTGKIESMSGRLKKKGDKEKCPEGQARNNDGECVPVATE